MPKKTAPKKAAAEPEPEVAEPNGYENYVDKTPREDSLVALNELARNMLAAQIEVEQAEVKLKEAQAKLRNLEEVMIPELMLEAGVTKIVTKDKISLEIKDATRASIPVDSREAAYDWLNENGHGALIKRSIVVSFTREQEEEAKKFLEETMKVYPSTKLEQKVEPQTLVSFVKKELKAGKEFPIELFGVFEQKFAKITDADRKSIFGE